MLWIFNLLTLWPVGFAQDISLKVTLLPQFSTGMPFTDEMCGNLLRTRLQTYKSWLNELISLNFSGDVEYVQGNRDFITAYKFVYSLENSLYALPLQHLTYSKTYHALFLRVFRLNLKFNFGPITLKAGRQFIDWGKGYFFFPLNPFTPTVNLSAEPSQVPGIDGVTISFDITDFLSAETVWTVKNEKHFAGINLEGSYGGVDFSLTGWWNGENMNGGGSVAFNLLQGLVRAEVLIPRKKFNALLGYDFYPGEGFEITLEYYLNLSEGKSSPEKYPINQIADTPPSSPSQLPDYISSLAETFFNYAPGRGKLGIHYLGLLISKNMNFPLTFSFAFEANLSDSSYLFMPFLKWEATQWLEVTGGAILGVGGELSEFHMAGKNAFLLVDMFF